MSAPNAAAPHAAGAGADAKSAGASAAPSADQSAKTAQAAQAKQIARALETLDTLFASERHHLHPQLAHFLQNRSYAKALSFLGGAEGEIPHAARKPPRPNASGASTSTRAADNAADGNGADATS